MNGRTKSNTFFPFLLLSSAVGLYLFSTFGDKETVSSRIARETPAGRPPLSETVAATSPAPAPIITTELPRSIRRGSMLYLVLGKTYPAQRWIDQSTSQDVSMLYMAWQVNISAAAAKLRGPKFRTVFNPNSTWTTCRNALVRLAMDMEQEQGWSFEYFVFFDEDVVLDVPEKRHECGAAGGERCSDAGFRLVHQIVLADRPMLFALSYADGNRRANARCIQRCHVDHLMMGFHRTAVSLLLPYSPALDGTNWWSSAYLRNMFMSAVAPEYCSYIQEVVVYPKANEHHYYPKSQSVRPGEEFVSARQLSSDRLAQAGVPGFKGLSGGGAMHKVMAQLNPDNQHQKPCIRSTVGVNFEDVLGPRSATFRRLL